MEYKDAGVDIDMAKYALSLVVDDIRSTFNSNVIEIPNSFAGVYKIPETNVCAVISTDGVGTKSHLLAKHGRSDVAGYDLVAMNVNDVLAMGARPFIFVDYYGTNKINPQTFKEVLTGVVEGCKHAGTSLLGGETAEMVDTYAPDVEFELVGTCVGFAVEEEIIKPQERIKKGDVILGLESNGFHANGFSLIRKVLEDKGIDVEKFSPLFGAPPLYFIEKKTRIYVREVIAAIRRYRTLIHGLAHITGGGVVENLSRIFPPDLSPQIDLEKWEVPKEFQVIQELGEISYGEMFRTFNMGIGFIIVVDERAGKSLTKFLSEMAKYKVKELGRVIEGDGNIKFR